MSHFPQTGHFGGPYPYQQAQPQYAPAPPPPPNYVVPQQPYAQQHPPQGYVGPSPQNGPMIQYANVGSYQGNAHFSQHVQNPPIPPPQPPSQPYYGYGQFVNGVPPPAYSTPAPLPSYNSAAPPHGLIQGTLQRAVSPGAYAPPKSLAVSGTPRLGVEPSSPRHLNNGNARANNAVDTHIALNEANTVLSKTPSGQSSVEYAPRDSHSIGLNTAATQAPPPLHDAIEVLPEVSSKGDEPYTPEDYTPPQLAQRDPHEVIDLNTPEHPNQSSHIVLDTPPSEPADRFRHSAHPQPDRDIPSTGSSSSMGNTESHSRRSIAELEAKALRDKKREAAQAAIRELHDRGIGYHQLVAESINPTLLREFYDELGITVPPSNQMRGQPQDVPPKVALEPPAPLSTPTKPQPSASLANTTQARLHVPASDLSEGEVSATSSKRGSPVPPGQAQTKASVPTKKPPSSAAPIKPMERKDYIAKLLAAKAAVKQANSARGEKPAADSPTIQRQASATTSSEQPAAKSAPATEADILSDDSAADLKKDVKSSAKTELVRQRLEALQNSGRVQPAAATKQPEPPTDNAMQLDQGPPNEPNTAAAAVASQHSPSTPGGSFFAIGDRKSFGGLPGLGAFELPGLGALQAPAPPVDSSRPAPASPPQAPKSASRQPSVGGISGTFEHALPAKPATSTATPTRAEAPPIEQSVPPKASAPTEPRKRATALDFIDGPSSSSKRPMMSKEPISLVIEVSDDEDEARPTTSGRPPPIRSDSGSKSFRDGPPLSNFPHRPGHGSKTATPPKTQNNPKGLAQTEEQIRLLQQKIAEMEQRKKTKQPSTASTPRAATSAAASATQNEAVANMSKAIQDNRQVLENASQQLVAQQETLAAAQTQVTETLETGQKSQAMIIARAEAEARAAERATTQKQREARLARKAQLEATLPGLNAQMEAAQKRLDEMLRQQEEIRAEIQRGDEGRQALLNELDSLSELLAERISESPPPEEASVEPSHVDESRAMDPPVEEALVEETRPELRQPSYDDAQNAPEPTSAADVTPSSSSVSVLGEFSPPPQPNAPALEAPNVSRSAARGEAMDVTMMETTMDISSSSADEGQIIESRQSPYEEHSPESDADMESGEEYEPPAADTVSAVAEAGHQTAIARSPQHAPSTPDDGAMDLDAEAEAEEEDYEPEDIQEPENRGEPNAVRDAHTLEAHEAPVQIPEGPDQDNIITIDSDENDQEATQTPNAAVGNPPHQSLAQGSSTSSTDSASEEGEIDEGTGPGSDGEYEPPEPTPPVDNPPAANPSPPPDLSMLRVVSQVGDMIHDARLDREPVPGASNVSHNAEHRSAAEGNGEVAGTASQPATERFTHFTPYESPLSRFSSYRYHPEYVQRVPGGFRSLTYSHKIDAQQPFCRWELAGGVCNNSACDFQHFRDLALTDNNILLQLGSVQEGTTPEQKESYISGLKEIITSMRSRNLKDVSAVLSEIVAYRSRFLGDSSRVLTNIL